MTLDLDPTLTLATALLVLLVGGFLVERLGFLRDHNIPIPVVGGILFAVVTTGLWAQADLQLSFDMALKGPMMLAFFTTIGLGADLRLLAHGGRQLLWFAAICLLYLVVQNTIGVAAAVSMDLHPLVGLLSSSITLSGGHGTGVAYAQQFADVQNLAGAMELALACATFGLIIGGLLGGPIAGHLIRRRELAPEPGPAEGDDLPPSAGAASPITGETLLVTLFWVVLCLIGGALVGEALAGAAFTLPGFVWSLLIGVAIRNGALLVPRIEVHQPTVEVLGGLSLSIFLAMALMSLQLWELMVLAGPLVVMLALQAAGMAAFATFVTFRAMGGGYDAAIIAGGHCGFGLGATPTAVANMQALTRRFGESRQAFMVVPLMGAFFIDILNAIVIQAWLALPLPGF
jgi:ESS family glutamate:Na+ symporter